MKVLIFGGTGFVGLNIAEALLARGHDVTLYDRAELPSPARRSLADHGARLKALQGDITDTDTIDAIIAEGVDAIVLGAAITAGEELERASTARVLEINVMAQIPILLSAIRRGVRRVVNLSSASAYGAAGARVELLDEETPCDPASFYAISKFTSERSVARHAELFGGDFLSVRLSAVFGPWERPSSVRDTPSLQFQILAAFARDKVAVMPEAGVRDWIYAPDAAEAVAILVEAERPRHRLYNISRGELWPALQWGEAFATLNPGLQCRLAAPGENTAIKLHGSPRAPLSVRRMADEFGWRARFGCVESAAAMSAWLKQHKEWI
ncbi:NAD(P)-dependent oxidoreductase [Bradyrhizobium sp. BR13661]|jgi:UDP-glucose 4-epimerase|uniref:NAD-dependent epimerase/dehydratase family protein n=1 Tax=Bradyrhizobium sp. BR13661 TaxID=2940622 RepID=UPI00247448B8|nr:NAD(P)-dependent oxidoreductase [Bradyrhizobium sp. BR13661]MDH6261953.1 UDP-glucose 4-epimerase [Bradyrhizobium sp. BR13661]